MVFPHALVLICWMALIALVGSFRRGKQGTLIVDWLYAILFASGMLYSIHGEFSLWMLILPLCVYFAGPLPGIPVLLVAILGGEPTSFWTINTILNATLFASGLVFYWGRSALRRHLRYWSYFLLGICAALLEFAFARQNSLTTLAPHLLEAGLVSLLGGSFLSWSLEHFANIEEQHKCPDQALALLQQAFSGCREAVMITNLQGDIEGVNPAFTEITGYCAEDILGKNPRFLKGNHHDLKFYETLWKTLMQTGSWEGQIWNRVKQGEVLPFHLHISQLLGCDGQPHHYLGILSPFSDGKLAIDSRQFSAFDQLTHLESRGGFLTRLSHSLEDFIWKSHSLGVVALDIANFKKINNTFGHLAGDTFLEVFAQRMREKESDQFHFARLGGDEFLIGVRQNNPEIQLQPLFDLIASIVREPISVQDEPIYLSVFMGVAIAEPDMNPEMLVKQADTALHQAKQQKTPYVVFDGKMQRQAMQDLTLSKKLKFALESSIIDVFYQPKVDLKTGRIRGMEALARWKDEQGIFIPPGIFVPLAEKNGLINHLFQIIVSKTVKDMAKLFLPVQRDLLVSINLSAHQFEITDLVQEITCRVDHERIPREAFEFEVTESVFIANMEKTRATLQQFKQEGFQLSLDDFGTGFSSLTYLNYLPFDTLKIDKSFVDPVPLDLRMNAMTKSIINLSHAINLHCVAEGVESKAQLEFLTGLGCDYCQGYYFSPPVDRNAFLAMIQKQN